MKPSEFTCADVQPHLPLMAGGVAGGSAGDDLEPGLVVAVRVHTSNCAECAGELRRIEAALDSLREVRDERLIEVDLWSGVRAGLRDAGVLETGAAQPAPQIAHVGATTVVPALATRRKQIWSSGVRLRRWSAAAALALAFGTATFVISGSGSNLNGSNPDAPAVAPNSEAKFAVRSATPPVSHDLSLPAPVNLASDGGGLRRATTEEQRAWRPAQPFSLQAMDGTSSDGAFVARDRHLR
jgi:hypothetical protein